MPRAVFILSLLLSVGIGADASGQTVRTHVTTDTVRVGERFELAITLDRPRNFDYQLPEIVPGQSRVGDLEILSLKSQQTFRPTDRQVDSLVFAVTTFVLDEARIPPVNVMFVSESDTVFAASSPASVPVRSVVPGEADQILDLAPIAEFPLPWLAWVLAAAAILVIAALLYYLYRRYRRRPMEETPQEPRPPAPRPAPYQEAKSRLVTLARRFPLSERDLKPFFVELSDLLRTYIGRTTGISALEMTSAELLSRLKRAEARSRYAIDDPTLDLLKAILDVTDFVKFADGHPSESEIWTAFESTSRLIDNVEQLYNPPRLPADRELLYGEPAN